MTAIPITSGVVCGFPPLTMSERKRVVVFAQSFLLIALAMWMLEELCLFLTAPPIDNPDKARLARETASAAFAARYHLMMVLSSMVIASRIAFHWMGAAIGAIIAIGLSFVLDASILGSVNLASLEALARKLHLGAASGDTEPLTGRQMMLASPITVQSRYGKARIPAGTPVTVLRQDGDSIWINVLGGETTIVKRASLK